MRAKRITLIGFRKQRGLSQQELGRQVAKRMGLDWTDTAAQKRISNWESGLSEPNDQEQRVLAKILGVSLEQIKSNLGKTSQDSIFHWLARSEAEQSFIGICCTSGPREIYDLGMLESLQKGIAAQKISVAIFIPGNTIPNTDMNSTILNGYIAGVHLDVLEYYRCLLASSEDASNRVKVYQPATELIDPFPPMRSCHYLVAYRDRGTLQSRLYLWVRTVSHDELMLVDSDYTSRTTVWQNYFTPVFTTWERKGILSEGGGFWKISSNQ